MADPKQDESFKVVDRRLFTAEGELRKDALEQERRETETAKKIEGKPGAAKSDPSAANKAAAIPTTASPAAVGAAETPAPSRSFQMLVDFLARNAALLLGGYADPRTGQAILDLDGAREMIDMLDALQEKTKGNLAPDDERVLLDVLGSLKLSFLEMSKAAAEAMKKEKAKTRGS